MVLESIMNPKNAEDKPWHVFFIAIIYSIISMYFANHMFPSQSSVLSIALITIVFVPFFQKLFEMEEEEETAKGPKGNLFSRHKKIIFVFSSFFLGVTVAVAFSFIFMPKETFSLQAETLKGFSGLASGSGAFSAFFINNSQVMILMFILSAMFGAGAIFILAWNASVIGVYAGNFMQAAGLNSGALLYGVPLSLGGIALHGIPEILAYFVAGLAGGILSVGIIREQFMSREFKKIFKDSIVLLVTAEFLIVVAAWLEAAF